MTFKNRPIKLSREYQEDADCIIYPRDAKKLLKKIPDKSIQLIITSPPYNVGKEYEKKVDLETYKKQQKEIIDLCIPLLKDRGSICWQVGNYISKNSEVVPLDILLYDCFKDNNLILRNRIIWHFGHGLHSSKRFSGRYETIMWFSKNTPDYVFNLDEVRVKQKYPGKRHYKGPNTGKYSGNPMGKNPSDIWDIPNVKANHIEKTKHPCQFPMALVIRLVKSLSEENDWILDPFLGVGTTACAAILENRRAIGAEIIPSYRKIAKDRILRTWNGTLKYRELEKPIFEPKKGSKLTIRSDKNKHRRNIHK